MNPFFKKLNSESSVEQILFTLKSVLTDWDTKQALKSGHNPYAMSHYLEAIQEIKTTDRKRLLAALSRVFIYENGRFSLPPINKVMKKAGLM